MSTDFNWQTETEDWEALPVEETAVVAARRPPWLLMGVLLLVLLAGAFALWRLQVQMEETAARLQEEVAASHRVVREAAANGDRELLRSFISSPDAVWSQIQQELLAHGTLFDYSSLGLQPSTMAAPQLDITLSNDLSTADVVVDLQYVSMNPSGVTETVRLQQTAVYRWESDRWLWSPPRDKDWGYRGRAVSQYLTFTYPERDAGLVRRLSYDLDDTITAVCRLEGISCPLDLELTLRFETDPQSLLRLSEWTNGLRARRTIVLPTPSLVGMPQDQASYRALSRGYRALVAGPLIADLVDYDCCEQAHFFQALLHSQLNQLALRPSPLQPAGYERLLAGGTNIQTAGRYWTADEPLPTAESQAPVYAVVAFVLSQNPDVTAADMQRHLNQAGSYPGWLATFLTPELMLEQAAWRTFLLEQMNVVEPVAPPHYPNRPVPFILVGLTYSRKTHKEPGMLYNHLKTLESEAIYVIREVAAQFERPFLLFSGGKDSIILTHLARKAFYPATIPIPLLHVDTGHNFPETLQFRDALAEKLGARLVVRYVQDSIDQGRVVEETGPYASRNGLQTVTLLDALAEFKVDAAIGGARRDEEKARAKERFFSHRDEFGQWDPKNQRPELWNLYNGRKKQNENFRIFPISNWTELDVWQYIERENIQLPSLYFCHERPVIERDGVLLAACDVVQPVAGETISRKVVRFRTIGDITCTGAIESTAASVADIVDEVASARVTERGGRADDRRSEAAMEDRKKQGYF